MNMARLRYMITFWTTIVKNRVVMSLEIPINNKMAEKKIVDASNAFVNEQKNYAHTNSTLLIGEK